MPPAPNGFRRSWPSGWIRVSTPRRGRRRDCRLQPAPAPPADLEGLTTNLRRRGDRWYWHWDPKFVSGSDEFSPLEIHDVDRLNAAVGNILGDGVPMLLVRGQLSDLVSAESAELFLTRFPQVEFIDVAGAGHMVAGDRNDIFADAVLGFLARHTD